MPPLQRRLTKGELKKKEEMDNLALKEEELAEKINESQSKHDRVSKDNKFKTAQLRNFQKQVERQIEINRRELVGEEENIDSIASMNEDVLFQLNASRDQYQLQLESSGVIARENYNARQAVNHMRESLSQMKTTHNDSMQLLRKEMFEIRMKIELTFRKTKKASEEQYERKANETMRDESDKAVVENARLRSVLTVKREEVMGKMEAQKSKELRMKKEKIDRDVVETSVTLQEEEIELLERYQKEQEVRRASAARRRATRRARCSRRADLRPGQDALPTFAQLKMRYRRACCSRRATVFSPACHSPPLRPPS